MKRFFEHENYFHPGVAHWQGKLLMILHRIYASDTFSPPMWCLSTDDGDSWSEPVEIPGLGHLKCADFRPLDSGFGESVLVMGLIGGKTAWLSFDGKWSPPHFLSSNPETDFRGANLQSASFPGGGVLIPFYYRESGSSRFSVITRRFHFDGTVLKESGQSNILSFEHGRGFLEPSVVCFNGRFYLTLRAEDNAAYWTESADGLSWSQVRPWLFDDGSLLVTGSTQQHWLKVNKRLFLVYTRKTDYNVSFFRWRTPLFSAEFVPERGCLLSETEHIVFPVELYRERPNLMGNFHVMNGEGESVISDAALWFDVSHETNQISWLATTVYTEKIIHSTEKS